MGDLRHFHIDVDLSIECSSHWASCDPFPDPLPWAEIDDPSEGLRTGLETLHRWYRQNEAMLSRVIRDTPIVPAQGEVGWS